jgi:transcriptional regulator with GAF, ATPase, and Fis domain
MTEPAGREGDVLDAVVSLVDSLLHDFDVVELLTQLSERCVHLLDVASAGLLLADPNRQLRLMAATSDRTRDLELFQLQADQGPCLDCYATGRPVSVGDLHAETRRWPQFVDAATRAGFASVHAVPMRAAGLVLGALGLFGTTAGELNDADLAVGQTLAHIATVAIVQERAPTPDRVLPQLRSALTSRTVVEQAKGFLRADLDLSIDESFVLLRRYALASGQHLTDIARSLVSDRSSRRAILTGIRELAVDRRR